MALGFRERGIPVVAITSVVQSRQSRSRHASGRRLFEVAEVAVDTGVPAGDAAVALPGLDTRAGACSTVAGAAAIQSILVEAVADLLARGRPVPVLASANVGDAGEEVYRRQIEPYAARIPYYDVRGRNES